VEAGEGMAVKKFLSPEVCNMHLESLPDNRFRLTMPADVAIELAQVEVINEAIRPLYANSESVRSDSQMMLYGLPSRLGNLEIVVTDEIVDIPDDECIP